MITTLITILYRVTVLWLLVLILESLGHEEIVEYALDAIKIWLGLSLAGVVIFWIASNWHQDRQVDWLNPTNPLRKKQEGLTTFSPKTYFRDREGPVDLSTSPSKITANARDKNIARCPSSPRRKHRRQRAVTSLTSSTACKHILPQPHAHVNKSR